MSGEEAGGGDAASTREVVLAISLICGFISVSAASVLAELGAIWVSLVFAFATIFTLSIAWSYAFDGLIRRFWSWVIGDEIKGVEQ